MVVVAVALLVGFRPEGSALGYLGALGMVALFVLAISWVSVVVGLVPKSVEAAGAFTSLAGPTEAAQPAGRSFRPAFSSSTISVIRAARLSGLRLVASIQRRYAFR